MDNFKERIKSKINDYDMLWSSDFFIPEHFDKLENKIGIYSWHLLPSNYMNEESIFKYLDIFKDNVIGLEGKSNFAKYEGEVKHVLNIDSDKILTILKDKTTLNNLIIATALFSPSLYIGVSKNIKNRISQHFKILKELYHKNNSSDLFDNIEDLDKDEAKNFAERISNLFCLNDSKSFSLNSFCVRVLYLDSFNELDRDKLEAIEYFLNRTYKPKFGKN